MEKKNQSRIIDRIRKCLALAANAGATEHEAAAAMRQAQKLMAEHGVNDGDILAAEVKEQKAKAGAISTPPKWECLLAERCGRAFGCIVIFRRSIMGDAGDWIFAGHGSRPEIALYAFKVLYRQCKKARKEYATAKLRRCKAATKIRRSDMFCDGWVVSAVGKLQGLTLSEREQHSMDAYLGKMNLSKRDPRDRNANNGSRNINDYAHGRSSGQSASLSNAVAADSTIEPRRLA